MGKVRLKVKRLEGWGKVRGLAGFSKPQAIMFKTYFGIHTFGLRFPIDVLVLDKDEHVVKLGIGLPPNRIFFWSPIYNTIIELPEGTLKSKKIKKGAIIDLVLSWA